MNIITTKGSKSCIPAIIARKFANAKQEECWPMHFISLCEVSVMLIKTAIQPHEYRFENYKLFFWYNGLVKQFTYVILFMRFPLYIGTYLHDM